MDGQEDLRILHGAPTTRASSVGYAECLLPHSRSDQSSSHLPQVQLGRGKISTDWVLPSGIQEAFDPSTSARGIAAKPGTAEKSTIGHDS